ncbi:hypothetical protein THRCLA_20635 [Thraustotheca clavata]|uniref:Uncharacterized protein n=1 Tax=Thraustotheca clavata TaxID=74557 RepID=A0A1W0A5A7_9STRA|nr:hypothetical protein THRCLA_20635 [Thraustotheca clavata]
MKVHIAPAKHRTLPSTSDLLQRPKVQNSSLYFYEAEQDVELLRQPIRVVEESQFTFSGLAGAVFYSNRARNTVKNYGIGLIKASSTSLVELGLLFGQPSSVSGIWVATGPNNKTLLYFAAQLSRGTVQ